MPPNINETQYRGSLGFRKPITGVTETRHNGDVWLDGRRIDDGAEGYWRVHNGLYELSNFVKQHPGGSQWLELTQGTDITEAFEVHHVSDLPENLLKKFYVKDAVTPRMSPFTFNDDGLYRTLKRNVREELKKVPKRAVIISGLYTDFLLLSTFLFSILACRYWNYWIGVIAGYFMSSLTIAAHNYFHQRDNLRMYYFNLGFLNYREWRITHSLSHHLYTNTIFDVEMSFLQPFANYFPVYKGFTIKYLSWIYTPMLWFLTYHASIVKRIIYLINSHDTRSFDKSDIIPYSLPLMMYLIGNQTLMHSLWMWTFILLCGSFHVTFIGLSAAHHHPDIFHDGDTPRKDMDWAKHQLDAVMDRKEITGSHYLVLTSFGDHALHHLFPSLDQGLLQHIYPVFKKTLKQFDVEFRMTSQFEMVKGQFRQLSRTEPNTKPRS